MAVCLKFDKDYNYLIKSISTIKLSKKILRSLLFCLLAFNTYILNAQSSNTYYIDSKAGNDNNTGNTAAKPWKTLDKVNKGLYSAGDQILFKRGSIFSGQLIIKQSGQSNKNITYSVYGTGPSPIINGLDTLSKWKLVGNGIWEAETAVANTQLNILIFDGQIAPIGRYPNSNAENGGYMTYESHVGNNTIIDKNLKNDIDWTGADVVVRRTNWILDKGKITSQGNNQITYNTDVTYTFKDNYGYFIQNDVRTLDQPGEWYYEAATKKIKVYFGTVGPSSHVVCVPVYDNLVNISGSFVTIKNLRLRGSNVATINVNKCADVDINDNNLVYAGKYGILANGSNINLNSNIIDQTNDIGIKGIFMPFGKIANNVVSNTGLLAGMGDKYTGIDLRGDNLNVSNNTVEQTGYNGIRLAGNNATIKNNVISNFTSVIDDGGGIYLFDKKFRNRSVINNIIFNGLGAPSGANKTNDNTSEGIYADDSTSYINIIGNTVSNVAGHGIKIHNAHDIIIKGNTLYNNKTQLILDHDKNPNGGLVRNITVTKNTFVPGPATQNTLTLSSPTDDVKDYGNIDSNYYVSTTGSSSPITVKTSLGQLRDAQLATSVTSTIFDKNSKKFALLSSSANNLRAAPANNVLIKTNRTSKPQTISLGNGTFVDLNGKQYIKSVNLAPFTSLILLKK